MLTEEQIRDIQFQLQERKALLERQLSETGEAAKPVQLDQQLQGRLSRMDAIQQQQMAAAGRKQLQAELKAIAVALQKIDDDDYGYCEACDEEIAWQRLQARPTCRLCINCQEKRER